jgi:hypothetical protein
VNQPDALALADRLTRLAGLGRVCLTSPLRGGRNNQVFRLEMESGAPLVLKRYFFDSRDGRDRCGAEWNFLDRAWRNGIRAIPQPFVRDEAAHAALYSFLPGRKLTAAELTPAQVDAAADFVLAINATPHRHAAPASEACFCIADHLAIVERRLNRLAELDPEAPHRAKAERFVSRQLRPVWEAVRLHVTRESRKLGLDIDRRLRDSECCLSPSDFGFHNALAAEDGRISFLDFEYAGQDDPAKLVVDFFSQPQIPVPLRYFDGFVARLALGLRFDTSMKARCRLLLDTCRIKWVCIMLNDFLPIDAARRSFADGTGRDIRCARQLEQATAKLDEILVQS